MSTFTGTSRRSGPGIRDSGFASHVVALHTLDDTAARYTPALTRARQRAWIESAEAMAITAAPLMYGMPMPR